MNTHHNVVKHDGHHHHHAVAAQQAAYSYMVTVTSAGDEWLHSPGSDFLFAYISKDWDAGTRKLVADAFTNALKMSSTIKQAVKDTSGQDVVNGLYLLDQTAMTKAMNTIPGMGQTLVKQERQQGSGMAVQITGEFFAAILAGLGSGLEVAPLMTYLTQEMGDLQAQTKKSTVTRNFGTVIGLVSVMPELGVVTTTFQYAFSSAEVADWLVKVNCGSAERYSYDYSYTVVSYNYAPSSAK